MNLYHKPGLFSFAVLGIMGLLLSGCSFVSRAPADTLVPIPFSSVPVPALTPPAPSPIVDSIDTSAKPVIIPTQNAGSNVALPTSFLLGVPFTPQAPTANWDVVHEETCEEASLLMVNAFYHGKPVGRLPAAEVEQELLSLVDAQKNMFGYFEDTTVSETIDLAQEFYGLQARVLEEPTREDIKRELLLKHPVILPAAGKLLHNPNFKGEGPLYHMIVIRGFTRDSFITNDPGTKKGDGYTYTYTTLMEAMHDWDSHDILKGAKRAFVLLPP